MRYGPSNDGRLHNVDLLMIRLCIALLPYYLFNAQGLDEPQETGTYHIYTKLMQIKDKVTRSSGEDFHREHAGYEPHPQAM
jgi:hypothetical protein